MLPANMKNHFPGSTSYRATLTSALVSSALFAWREMRLHLVEGALPSPGHVYRCYEIVSVSQAIDIVLRVSSPASPVPNPP